ncbi:MAG: hypothetical protein AAF438_07705 [Pseudomonadota bacterium]
MNRNCPGCQGNGSNVVRYGSYYRRSDARHIQRFRCNQCSLHFSNATFSDCYRQKKRRLNHRIMLLLSSAVSMRRIAVLLGVSKTTVARKLIFLADQARKNHQHYLDMVIRQRGMFAQIQFDDLETFEHTKCKPLTVTVIVEPKQRLLIDFAVAPIAAKGPLAAISKKKYGERKDLSRMTRQELFQRLCCRVNPGAEFSSDEHAHYPMLLRRHFPNATHHRYKSIRGCITGQGELKKTQFDPLFGVNHTLAMLRANLNRLVRRTWCTTKLKERLADHLAIYQHYHNQTLLNTTPQALAA